MSGTNNPPQPQSTIDSEFKEQLAAIEHERWSDWQKYMQSLAKADWSPDGETIFTYTVEQFARWNRQIETPYSELSEREKASDMEQVDRYWHLIEQKIAQEANKAVLNELKAIADLGYRQFKDEGLYQGLTQAQLTSKNLYVRIEALTSDKEQA